MFSSNNGYEANFELLRETLSRDGRRHGGEGRFITNDLRAIEEIPHPYQQIFNEYSHFNVIQSKVVDDVLYSDHSLAISAPTGSGKTILFELAIVRLLISLEHTQFSTPFKIVYICPLKALCEERLVDWHKKFANFGINAIAVTGDSENVEFHELLNHNLIITTPEKWDCLTRKWRENVRLVKTVKLFMIDEIHLLNEENRGSTLETVICRMKTIADSINPEGIDENLKIRFIAVSATVPNIEDVADWMGNSTKYYKFSEDYRPVKLNKIVMGYIQKPKSTPFAFDLSLNYRLNSLIMQYSHGKPTLIFCSTRRIVETTAKYILQNLTLNLKPEQKECLFEAAETISDVKAKETLLHGVGYHHAGMLPQTRRVIENLFRNNHLPILVTTRTLAIGVNLPAHLVIIKSTKCYVNGGFQDYTETALLQMIGRAGRPQYDTEATALILTTSKDKEKFERMIGGLQPIESDLHRHLITHLNAEVVLQTITDLEVAMRWLSATFLYIRARKNPRYYGLTSSDPSSIDRRLLELCKIELNKLIKAGMLTIDQDVLLKATPVGSTMAKYCLDFETMKLFTQITGGEILKQILGMVSKCHEFSEMYIRVNDKTCLNLLNKCRNRETIRFRLNGSIKTVDMKINCIIQAVLGCLDICNHSLLTEALKIMRNGERIVKCLIEYLELKNNCFQALLSAIILAKCFHVQLWENSPYVSKQLAGIGNVMSSQLANAGKTTFGLISQCDPREIEMIINKKPPAGSKILKQVCHLPKYSLRFEPHGRNELKLTISLQNFLDLERTCTVNRNSLMYLLVGDIDNRILLYEKYSHSFLIENPEVERIVEFQNSSENIEAHLISEDWAGIDCMTKFEIEQFKEPNPKKSKVDRNVQNDDQKYMQTFMDVYLKGAQNKKVRAKTNKNKSEENLVECNDKKGNVNNRSDNSKIIIHSSNIILENKINKTQRFVDNQKLELNSGPTDQNLTQRFVDNQKLKSGPTDQNLNGKTSSVVSKVLKKNEKSTNNQVPSFYSVSSVSLAEPGASKEAKTSELVLNNSEYLKRNFGFLPKRKLESERSQHLNSNVTPEPSVKKPNKPKSHPKITWRSPLTYSPPVKFSPRVTYDHLITNRVDASPCHTSSSASIVSSREVPKNSPFQRTPLKLNSSKSKIVFPLTDKACADSSLEESIDRRDRVLEEIGDFVSDTFLESFGLISPKDKVSRQVKNANDYYHQLMLQPKKKTNASEIKFETSKDTIIQGNYPTSQKSRLLPDFKSNIASNENFEQYSGSHYPLKNNIKKSESKSRFFKESVSNSADDSFLRNTSLQKEKILPSEHLSLVSSPNRRMRRPSENSDTINRTKENEFNGRVKKTSRGCPYEKKASSFERNQSRSSFEKSFVFNNEEGKDDPFDDSFEKALMEYESSELMRNNNGIKRQNSNKEFNFEEIDNITDVINAKETPPVDNKLRLFETSRTDDIADRITTPRCCSTFLPLRNISNIVQNDGRLEYQRRENYLNYGENDYIPPFCNYQNNSQFLPRGTNEPYGFLHREPADSFKTERTYDRNEGFRDNNFVLRPHFDRLNSRRYEMDGCNPSQNIFSSSNYQPDNNEGYSYLRRIMEKENDPLQQNTNGFRNSTSLNPIPESQSVYFERARLPQREYVAFENSNNYGRGIDRGHPSMTITQQCPDIVPQVYPYSHFTTQPERRHYYDAPYPRRYEADNYLVRRYLSDNNHNNM